MTSNGSPSTYKSQAGRRQVNPASSQWSSRAENFPTTSPIRRSSSSSSHRRSVSSMKGLMPLALSPVWTATSSVTSAAEDIESQLDGYFPEVLALDLERSSSAFSMRRLTSGCPERSLAFEDKDFITTASWPGRSTMGPRRSLDPIQERHSVVSFLGNREDHPDESSSDSDSMSGADISGGGVGVSITVRGVSISTTATSLTPSRSTPSPKSSPHYTLSRQHSWIEADSDDGEPEEAFEPKLVALSPRPPTPPESDSSHGLRDRDIPRSALVHKKKMVHRLSRPFVDGAPESPPQRRGSTRGLGLELERPATAKPPSRSEASPISPHAYRPRSSSLHKTGYQQRELFETRTAFDRFPPAVAGSDTGSTSENETYHHGKDRAAMPDFIRPSPPPSPLPTVQAWLNHNAPYRAQSPNDDFSRAIPLSADAVETLRVSVACFPETMLLSSSLTIDTIRNYSRKVRQPPAELIVHHQVDSQTSYPRRSFWKRVVSRRSPSISDSRDANPHAGDFKCPSSTSLESSKPWSSLKNVFGSCSDYVCDALWAHIVAYNYITCIAPKKVVSPSRPTTQGGRSFTKEAIQKEDIPAKAASLLGLALSPETIDRGVGKNGLLSWTVSKEGLTVEPNARTMSYDNAIRDIQNGLLLCIRRLIATATLMSENGSWEDRVVEIEDRDVDLLFVRSLCEIVRVSEEMV